MEPDSAQPGRSCITRPLQLPPTPASISVVAYFAMTST